MKCHISNPNGGRTCVSTLELCPYATKIHTLCSHYV